MAARLPGVCTPAAFDCLPDDVDEVQAGRQSMYGALCHSFAGAIQLSGKPTPRIDTGFFGVFASRKLVNCFPQRHGRGKAHQRFPSANMAWHSSSDQQAPHAGGTRSRTRGGVGEAPARSYDQRRLSPECRIILRQCQIDSSVPENGGKFVGSRSKWKGRFAGHRHIVAFKLQDTGEGEIISTQIRRL